MTEYTRAELVRIACPIGCYYPSCVKLAGCPSASCITREAAVTRLIRAGALKDKEG